MRRVELPKEHALVLHRSKAECSVKFAGHLAVYLGLRHEIEQAASGGPSLGALQERLSDALPTVRATDDERVDLCEGTREQRDGDGEMDAPHETVRGFGGDEDDMIAERQHACEPTPHGTIVCVIAELEDQTDEVGSVVDPGVAKLERHGVPKRTAKFDRRNRPRGRIAAPGRAGAMIR